MHIITEPKVYLVGSSALNWAGIAQFEEEEGIQWHTDPGPSSQLLCEMAGRLCYLSFQNPRPGGNQAYLQRILEQAHGSVLEHAAWNFIITNVSRSLSHELVRHRHFSFSQLSQRYVDESVAEYVCPDVIAQDPDLLAIWQESMDCTHRHYQQLVSRLESKLREKGLTGTELRKAARQAARSVLPNATETKIFLTGNARALRGFLEQRGSRHAEPEIRKVAHLIHQILLQEAPFLFGDYTATKLDDGTFELTTPYAKV